MRPYDRSRQKVVPIANVSPFPLPQRGEEGPGDGGQDAAPPTAPLHRSGEGVGGEVRSHSIPLRIPCVGGAVVEDGQAQAVDQG